MSQLITQHQTPEQLVETILGVLHLVLPGCICSQMPSSASTAALWNHIHLTNEGRSWHRRNGSARQIMKTLQRCSRRMIGDRRRMSSRHCPSNRHCHLQLSPILLIFLLQEQEHKRHYQIQHRHHHHIHLHHRSPMPSQDVHEFAEPSYYKARCKRMELQLKEHVGATTLSTTVSASEKDSVWALIHSRTIGPQYTLMDHSVKCELIVDALTDRAFMGGGQVHTVMLQKIKHYYRENVFTPHAILKFMDLTGGTLNYASYERIHDIESEAMGLPDQHLFHGILPSSSMLIKVGAKVEKTADKIFQLIVERPKWEKDFSSQMWPTRLSYFSRLMVCMKRQNMLVLS
jgi:hypothetical protein